MRDLLLVTSFAVALPLMVWRPVWGALAWVWFGIMNPHALTWGFATTLPFAWAIGVATLVGTLFSKEPKRLKGGAATVVLALFVCYMVFTTFSAIFPSKAWPMLERALKIQIGTFLVLMLLYKKEHVLALIWVIAGSIGFYAIKGGIFTVLHLGEFRVWGPAGFIQDNNAFALATVLSIPLWAYLYTQYRQHVWIRAGIAAAMAMSALSAIGSHSRGAVVAIAAMAVFLWLKSRAKLALGSLLVAAAFGLVAFMPASWEERVATITNPREDASANSRLETWTMLWNLAVDRPLTGGGFETYGKSVLETYNPAYDRVFAAHSIYFQVLGEHGFLALFLFLLFWFLVWQMCKRVAAQTSDHAEQQWAFWLAKMIQVSLVAYFVGGAFLNLAYWDVPYYLFVAIAVTRHVLAQTQTDEIGSTESSATASFESADEAARDRAAA